VEHSSSLVDLLRSVLRGDSRFLFSEFNRLGVLESEFYENDDAFADRPKLTPDPAPAFHGSDWSGRYSFSC